METESPAHSAEYAGLFRLSPGKGVLCYFDNLVFVIVIFDNITEYFGRVYVDLLVMNTS